MNLEEKENNNKIVKYIKDKITNYLCLNIEKDTFQTQIENMYKVTIVNEEDKIEVSIIFPETSINAILNAVMIEDENTTNSKDDLLDILKEMFLSDNYKIKEKEFIEFSRFEEIEKEINKYNKLHLETNNIDIENKYLNNICIYYKYTDIEENDISTNSLSAEDIKLLFEEEKEEDFTVDDIFNSIDDEDFNIEENDTSHKANIIADNYIKEQERPISMYDVVSDLEKEEYEKIIKSFKIKKIVVALKGAPEEYEEEILLMYNKKEKKKYKKEKLKLKKVKVKKIWKIHKKIIDKAIEEMNNR